MDKQLNLFGNQSAVHGKLPATKRHKRKYSLSHWSYRQRLVHEVSQSSNISWKQVYQLLNAALKHQPIALPTKRGRRFASTVNQTQLSKAVQAMYQHKHGNYPLSVNKISKKFKVSKPSLYRAYKLRYKNN